MTDLTQDADRSTRTRILEGTFEVLSRRGRDKLNLSEVASAAGVSRPTLYRFFASKTDLLRDFAVYEQQKIQQSLTDATAGLAGDARLEALLRAIVEFQNSYSLTRRVDVEPGRVLTELNQVVPAMREWLIVQMGPGREIAAAAVVRIAIAHYAIPSDDGDTFLQQLRQAAGLR
jgi:AcrR family transcriptional regulator